MGVMKTLFEVQHKDLNVKVSDIETFVLEDLNAKGVKDVESLKIYYVPETYNVFYVAEKKDGKEFNGVVSASDVPAYPEAAVKKVAVKKAAVKKPAAKKAAAKKVVAKKEEVKAEVKTEVKAAPTKPVKAAAKKVTKK